ncbi:SRPBCC family protein [Mycolicibacterium grossiae]|uniref:Polyketide cyclase n=1 Tax=Mycolicibacterium grossiae TaxID=1552759 RepID=A0A1E8Q7F0_9MYCO|nr:SRPBCC family protein [Mycolicibacterium grossiae]OFJ54010.1 polyketide cyclase [Mycolicibacterium grossiae]QEM44194.1 SRPBCC family protein [Mycolicibacterium grossiae]
MTASGPATASASVTVAAPPEAVYALLTDLDAMAEIGAEVHAMRWRGDGSARPGAVFTGRNRNGSRTWSTRCQVTDAEPGRVFAFDVTSVVIPVAHWRYDIEATADGCVVTESTWDRRPGWFRAPAGFATGVRDRTSASAQHIQLTLQRLKAAAES